MSDLISRRKTYEVLTVYYHHTTDTQHTALREALNRVPSAHPDIIRCKNCKLKDYELIRLRWHKNRPDWCPLVKQKIEDTGKSKLAPGNKRHAGRTTDYRNRGIGYKLNYCPECGRKL